MNAPIELSAFSAGSAGRLGVHGQLKCGEPTFYSGRVCEFSKGTYGEALAACATRVGAQVRFY